MYKYSCIILTCLLCPVLFGACSNSTVLEVDQWTIYSARIHPSPENGALKLSAEQVHGGTYISVYANPDPGYILEQIILFSPLSQNPSNAGSTIPCQVQINNSYSITATFIKKLPGTFTVSVDRGIENGIIYPKRLSETAGTELLVTVIPDEGYDLADGSLKIVSANDGHIIDELSSLPYTFTLPAEDVIIKAQFVLLEPEEFSARAWKYLNAGQYDTAAKLYETAYQRNKNDQELILYSTIAQLGNLLIDPNVRSILGTLYLAYVPSTINDWICDEIDEEWPSDKWYSTYAATTYTPEDAVLPRLNGRISKFVTPFGDFEINQSQGRDWLVAGDNRPTREKFKNLMFWILISSYTSGFNPFVDNVNRYIFSEKFESALARAESLKDDARVLLNPRLKERFNLEEIYGPGDTYIGKPELNFIFGTLLGIKGMFEFLSAYDWTIELRNWLVTEIRVDDGINEILDKMFSLQESNTTHNSYWKDTATVAKMLPLKNNFLQMRDSRALRKSRTSIDRALVMLNMSMDRWYGDVSGNTSQLTSEAKNKRLWARQGLSHAKNTVNGGIFYFPARMPTKDEAANDIISWPSGYSDQTSYGVKVYGLDTAKFFTPGSFSLPNLFTTELGGKAPSLFKIEWYEDANNDFIEVFTGNYSPITSPIIGNGRENDVGGTGQGAPYGIYSFEMNTKKLKEIFPKGFDDFGDAALFSNVFSTLPLWPWRTTYFTGLRKPASKLYEYYHKITVD